MNGPVLGSALAPPVHETGRAGRRDQLAEPPSSASSAGASPAASLHPADAISGASEIPRGEAAALAGLPGT
jgi:hypothetical protein